MDEKEIKKMLQKIKEEDAPKFDFKMEAMCYIPYRPPDVIEYICPVCGEKTTYPGTTNYLAAIDKARRHLAELRKLSSLSMELDESAYCIKCSPEEEIPGLKLVIIYPDGITHTAVAVQEVDFLILKGFFLGELSYAFESGSQGPLKDHLDRLQQLLGIELDEAGL